MKVLIIGGTGLISTGIVKHLLARGADVTVYNRSKRESTLPDAVHCMVGDRNDFAAFEQTFADKRFDVVMDMIGFNPEQAQSDVRAFGGRCEQFIFCSTVCTYGIKLPPTIFIDETFPHEPISNYGKNKVACEEILMAAQEAGKFKTTIMRPSSTYGEGSSMIDMLEGGSPSTWDRVQRDQPVLAAGDGLGLWVSTHRDDVGKLFAYAALNPKTYGESYNATREKHLPWREVYRQVSAALGKQPNVIFMPTDWLVKHDPSRFGLLKEITRFHGSYDSSKGRRDVPEFVCEVELTDGARRTFDDMRRRGVWKDSTTDTLYETMVREAMQMGFEPVTI